MTAASAALGVRPAPGLAADLRGVLVAGLLAAAFLAGALAGTLRAVLAGAALAAAASGAAVLAADLRGGNLDGANSKLTLPASLSHARYALNGRRVRIETNLSSRSVLPLSSSLLICSRTTGCCRMIWPLLKSHVGVACAAVGTDFSHT